MEKVLRIMGEVRPDIISNKDALSPAMSSGLSDFDIPSLPNLNHSDTKMSSRQTVNHHSVGPLKRAASPLMSSSGKKFQMDCSSSSSLHQRPPVYNSHDLNGVPLPGGPVDSTLLSPNTHMDISQRLDNSLPPSFENHVAARPMVMDPESTEVMEYRSDYTSNGAKTKNKSHSSSLEYQYGDRNHIDNYDQFFSPASQPDASSFKNEFSYSNIRSGLKTGLGQNDILQNESTSPYVNFVDDVPDDRFLKNISKDKLECLHLVSQIKLNEQRRRYIRLKEEKLLSELKMLRSGSNTSSGSSPATSATVESHPLRKTSSATGSVSDNNVNDMTAPMDNSSRINHMVIRNQLEFEVADQGQDESEQSKNSGLEEEGEVLRGALNRPTFEELAINEREPDQEEMHSHAYGKRNGVVGSMNLLNMKRELQQNLDEKTDIPSFENDIL